MAATWPRNPKAEPAQSLMAFSSPLRFWLFVLQVRVEKSAAGEQVQPNGALIGMALVYRNPLTNIIVKTTLTLRLRGRPWTDLA